MCEAGTIIAAASLAVGVGTAVAGGVSQSNATRAQNRYNKELGEAQLAAYGETERSVVRDVGLQIDQLAQREFEQTAATRQELENITKNVRQASGSARTVQAAMGVEGRSVDMLHQQFAREIAGFESTAMRNIRNFRYQSNMEAQAIYARGQSILNSGVPAPLPPAATWSPALNVLQGATTGIQTASALQSFRGPSGVGGAGNPMPPATTAFINQAQSSTFNFGLPAPTK
jgi:hypothetical protein